MHVDKMKSSKAPNGNQENGNSYATKSSEDMWRLIAESSVDAIIAIRHDSNVTLWNRTAEKMFGWKADEVIGRPMGEAILAEPYRKTLVDGLRCFGPVPGPDIFNRRLDLTALAKDGREFPIELFLVPLKINDGHLFVGFIRDMTEDKRLAERLRQSQKMEAIGLLAGGIAHDFNNILASITGNLVIARADTASDHPVQESLDEIEKAAKRATYVVRQILTFSSAKESKAEVINLEKTLIESIKLLRATLPVSMEIETHFEPNLPSIFADATDIHQVLVNLGINASQAMGGEGGIFEITTARITLDEATAESLSVNPGLYLRISARDTGSGMAPYTLSKIFEPFFTTKASGEGTGLGLSVVYGIVTRSNGAINVFSEEGSGTVFHIYLPAVAVEVPKPPKEVLTPVSGSGERILYVDDDEALVFMMTRLMRRLNYEVEGYQHPHKALAAFKADPEAFDLVITDMSMPHMDGSMLVRELQAVRPTIPIVMVTGYIRPADLEQTRDLGLSELILKPNTAGELSHVLHRVLQEARLAAPVPAAL